MKIRFVVLPPKNISYAVGKIAKKIGLSFPNLFVVDNNQLLPHITLFKAEANRARLPILFKNIFKTLKKTKPFKLRISGFDARKGGWLVLRVRPVAKLANLRDKLTSDLNILLKEISVRRPYDPHITLTRYRNINHNKLVAKNERPISKVFMARTVAATLSNKYRQVYKVLKRFRLR